jgi:hypothetical protein
MKTECIGDHVKLKGRLILVQQSYNGLGRRKMESGYSLPSER